MKIAVFELRQDEKKKLEDLKGRHGLELVTTGKALSKQTLKLAAGCEGVTILGRSKLDKGLLLGLKNLGVRYISTRTVGYNHIDVEYGKEIGLKMCNAGYPPKGVAEFAVMLMLLTLRNYKPAMWRQNVND
jgi:D-lactate dehydrogenase